MYTCIYYDFLLNVASQYFCVTFKEQEKKLWVFPSGTLFELKIDESLFFTIFSFTDLLLEPHQTQNGSCAPQHSCRVLYLLHCDTGTRRICNDTHISEQLPLKKHKHEHKR